MSHIDEIIQIIIDETCPIDNIKNEIKGIEINEINIEKIQQIENLIDLHIENCKRIKQTLRLKTSKYYRNRMIKGPQKQTNRLV